MARAVDRRDLDEDQPDPYIGDFWDSPDKTWKWTALMIALLPVFLLLGPVVIVLDHIWHWLGRPGFQPDS